MGRGSTPAKKANIHAVIVLRHGALVYEGYFARIGAGGWDRVRYKADMVHDLRSVTKCLISSSASPSAAGWIKDLDAKVTHSVRIRRFALAGEGSGHVAVFAGHLLMMPTD